MVYVIGSRRFQSRESELSDQETNGDGGKPQPSRPAPDCQSDADMDTIDLRPVRVMLVDDDTLVREAVAKLLQSERRIELVSEASDGREAVSLVNQAEPDVILMDVSMPNMDGLQATRLIREEHPEIGIIGLSMREDNAEAMYEAGASAYLFKGTSSSTLVNAILTHHQRPTA